MVCPPAWGRAATAGGLDGANAAKRVLSPTRTAAGGNRRPQRGRMFRWLEGYVQRRRFFRGFPAPFLMGAEIGTEICFACPYVFFVYVNRPSADKRVGDQAVNGCLKGFSGGQQADVTKRVRVILCSLCHSRHACCFLSRPACRALRLLYSNACAKTQIFF